MANARRLQLSVATNGKTRDALTLAGMSVIVDAMTDLVRQKDEIETNLQALKEGTHSKYKGTPWEKRGGEWYAGGLYRYAHESRQDALRTGEDIRMVEMPGSGGQRAKVIWKDAYKKIKVKDEQSMKAELGEELYSQLFKRQMDIQAQKGVSENDFLELVSQNYEPVRFLQELKFLMKVSEYIAPVEDFMTKRQQLRHRLSEEANEMIDDLIVQCQYKPQVRLK